MYININIRHINTVHIWYYAICFPNGPSSQMVWYTDADTDGKHSCRWSNVNRCSLYVDYCQLVLGTGLQGHPMVFGLEMVS